MMIGIVALIDRPRNNRQTSTPSMNGSFALFSLEASRLQSEGWVED
jgi:hypothetical protein